MSGIPTPFSMPEADRFKGTNFTKFNSQLLAGAKARGVVAYLKGTITRPSGPIPYVATAASPWYSKNPSEEEWDMRDGYTQSMIISNVQNPIGYGITDDMTAAQAYKALTSVFDVKSDLGLVTAERELRDIHYAEGADFGLFIEDIRSKWEAVNHQGGGITDPQFRGILINALPHSWDPVIAGLDSLTTTAAVENRLRLWDLRVNAPPTFASTGAANTQAMAAAFNGGGGSNAGLRCTNPQCGKSGHLAKDCFRPGGGKEGQYPAWWKGSKKPYVPGGTPVIPVTNTVAALAQAPAFGTAVSDQFDFMALMAVAQSNKPATMSDLEFAALSKLAMTTEVRTFIDSGATHHCFVDRADFATYTPASATGQTANAGASFRILGHGTVYKRVNMNGLDTILQFDAIHTPDFASNLISVSRLVENGCSVSFTNKTAMFTGPAFADGATGSQFMTAHVHDGILGRLISQPGTGGSGMWEIVD